MDPRSHSGAVLAEALQPGDWIRVWPDPRDLARGFLRLDGAWADVFPDRATVVLDGAAGPAPAAFDGPAAALRSPRLAELFPGRAKLAHSPAWFDGVKNTYGNSIGKWKTTDNPERVSEFMETPGASELLKRFGYEA